MPIELDDVCFNKAGIIERTLARALEEFAADPDMSNWSHIDALVLNLERSCQAAIDLAFHLIAKNHLGIPQESADAFRLLSRAGLIGAETERAMVGMTGFRNVAVHQYRSLDMEVVKSIMKSGWKSLVVYCGELGLKIQPLGHE